MMSISYRGLGNTSRGKVLWKLACLALMWVVWRERNARIFEDKARSSEGMMTTLRKLVLTGNPLRTLRSSLVSGPTPALLKFLRSRLSTDEDSEAATTAKENVVTMAARLSITSKELSLEGMGLSAVPAQVWESSEIVKVDLSRNSIQELPPELTSCVSLQALILSRNKIQEWPGVILKSLPNLSCLKLDNNPLRQVNQI
ncbi:Plant intracellular Ras-group-related LRR protein 6 [Vitis vinifera]|uniref:Plant intracellular Ras-group-related LRR protein 6 n=1 Tax=Vitis vinifera TaxID=29760 RepID=A0A438DLZ3_VITVI|nr:Plant intracellular Ras-group-related LRR protein 6 [Vitis vinifera]